MTILVVEDEFFIRMDIADTLREKPGVIVIEARTADDGWEYIATNGPVDVLFTDHRLPGFMTGSQLAARVSQEYPMTKVVVTSAHFDGTEWTGPVLDKPYDSNKIAANLVELARKKG